MTIRPLDGIRVIDLSAVVMGPFATQLLADLGADVVKVEPPEGDTTRQVGHARHSDMGAVFLTLGRNKRSVVLDLKTEDGLAALQRLIATADVFVHNMRPEATGRLKLDAEPCRALNPRLIYCAARGFDSRGPYRNRPAYDDMIQGACGMASVMGALFGEPRYVPMIFADKVAGLYVANAILAALMQRARTGTGLDVEVPMFEALTAFTLVEHLYDATFEPPHAPPGYPRVLNPARRPFRTRDGFVCALPYTDRHFQRFFTAFGRSDLLGDDRFASIGARLRHVGPLYEAIADCLAQHSTADCLAIMEQAEIPSMRVNSLDDLLSDPHLADTGFFELHDHPSEGLIRHCSHPARFDGGFDTVRRPAPRLGEHTQEILREIGLVDPPPRAAGEP